MSRSLQAMVPLFALALVWWLLSGGELSSWLVGVPAVLAAAWVGRRIGAEGRDSVSPLGLLRFLPYFLRESIRGGIDVASRVLRPRMRVAPGFVSYRTRLSGPRTRLLFLYSVSLLPGTLAADIEDDLLQVHALDTNNDFSDALRCLETAVGRVFGEGR